MWVGYRSTAQFFQDEQNHRQELPVQVRCPDIPAPLFGQWLVPPSLVLASAGRVSYTNKTCSQEKFLPISIPTSKFPACVLNQETFSPSFLILPIVIGEASTIQTSLGSFKNQ